MKLIVEMFYLIIWFLIKIGDSVLIPVSIIHSGIRNTLLRPRNPRRKKHIKKSKTLYTAKTHKAHYYSILLRSVNGWFSKTQSTQRLFSRRSLKFLTKSKKKIKKSIIKTGPRLKIFSGSLLVLLAYPFRSVSKIFHSTKKKRIQKRKTKEAVLPKIIRKPTLWYSIKLFIWGIAFSSVFVFLPLLSLLFLSDLPNPSSISTNYIPKTTKIFDRNGVLLYEIFANQNRTIVELNQIPENLKNATIAIEDREFYKHPGFDMKGIARALYSNAQNNNLQGGSTITQQLIKSSLLTPEPTITRKVKEIVLAFWAERIYSKQEILELYFNYVPYGGTAWGVSAASEVYFGKKIENLDLAESAFLAGLPRAPSVYSPYAGTGNLWKKRQKSVLNSMVQLKFITQEKADAAYKKELSFVGPNISLKAPHFVMYVKDLLIKQYGLSEVERGGLQVTTTLDYKTQEMAQNIVTEEVEKNAHLLIGNGAAVILNPQNGDILAMVGSKDYFDMEKDGNVNIVTSLRQPGSTIKIVTYSLALASGYTQATLLDDSPLTISPPGGESYTPVNYDGKFRGRIPLRLALANSLNIPAVRVAQRLGVDSIVEQGKKLGITTWQKPENYGVSITLGGAETTMLDLATVYGTFANNGEKIEPFPILNIKNSQGETIYKKTPEGTRVMDSGIAFIISDILSDNRARSMSFGSTSPLNIPNHHVSVKTGTTDNKRDNWTVGFTPDRVIATWVGNNDNTPMSPQLTSGISGAAPMWNRIITKVLEEHPEPNIIIPENVTKKSCFGAELYFLQGTESLPCVVPATLAPTKPPTARGNSQLLN